MSTCLTRLAPPVKGHGAAAPNRWRNLISTESLMTCSQLQASACAASGSSPISVGEHLLREGVLAEHAGGDPTADRGQVQGAVGLVELEQSVTGELGDGLADGGRAVLEPLHQSGPQRRHAGELELEHGAQIHLRRLGGVADCTHTGRPFGLYERRFCIGPGLR